MAAIDYCIPFLLERLRVHAANYDNQPDAPPFFLGLNGVQGAGKTVLVTQIKQNLEEKHGLPTVVFSMDDIYLSHEDQVSLARKYSQNPLLQHRGQPSTHDLALGLSVFSSLREKSATKIPQYNKAAFNGQGDRVPTSEWEEVNSSQAKIEIVLFEGWCTGFRPLEPSLMRQKWEAALKAKERGGYVGRLGHNRFEDVEVINEHLRSYDALTNALDALIHIDATDLQFVYRWRLEQEENLRKTKGSGMTDEEVRHFVDGYYPSYELFTETLRAGIFGLSSGRQLRLIVGEDRKVVESVCL